MITENLPTKRLEAQTAFDNAIGHGAQISFPPFGIVPRAQPRAGQGRTCGHHGEILQGVFEQPGGTLVRGLVSHTTPLFKSAAEFTPGPQGTITVEPCWKKKALRAAEVTLQQLGGRCGGKLKITSNMIPRWGMGSSTSDVVSAVRAVAQALGRAVSPEIIARIAVESETACDSTMFGKRAVLFAQRCGVVLEDLGRRLPPVHTIGFNTDPTGWGVDTLQYPPARYNWAEIEAFRPLLGLLRHAVCRQDATALGQVASASARINQRFLPKPRFNQIEEITDRCGGLGVQVAHSGTIVGILIAADDSWSERSHAIQRYVGELGFYPTWLFTSAYEDLPNIFDHC
ncbi:MAG TPA: hypothetical protein VE604_08380 [Candidatus Polarisedimenticolia bacterium]|nr:hypothetical protein [Candidatus Polarisedimenticolia bacterium]